MNNNAKSSGKTIQNIIGSKQIKFAGLKSSPSRPTPEHLALINQFTRKDYKAEDFYVGQIRMANNAIDRDNERFSEEVLTRFAATALRKTMMFDHGRNVQMSGVGKFFDCTIEKLPLQQANAETGESFQLPAGKSEVWFLTCSFYIPVKFVPESVIVGIDTGIYDFASIGFRAENLVPMRNEKDDSILFWEYRGSGPRTEMTEGSLVYLGAQHGMSVKTYGEAPEQTEKEETKKPVRLGNLLKPKTLKERRAERLAEREARTNKIPEQTIEKSETNKPMRLGNLLKPKTLAERRAARLAEQEARTKNPLAPKK